MLIWGLLKIALRSLRANMLRTFLTMLGIMIGVASVISMISLGEGARRQTLSTIAKFGTNIITVKPGEKKNRHVRTGKVETLMLEDAYAIRDYVHNINGVAAQVYQSGQLKFGNKNSNSTVRGASSDYVWIGNYQMDEGRFFTREEVRSARKICVLGATVVKNLFDGDNPVGQTLKVDGDNYLVIGTTVAKGALTWWDPDDQIFIPITTAQKRLFGLKYVQSIDIQVKNMDYIEMIKQDIETLLRRLHNLRQGEKSDFYVQNSAEWLNSWGKAAETFQFLLGGIAAISLLVGGIGIMNIMLVSVTERTREIGIRIAIGAKKREIRKQFLIESILISFLGGSMGIGLGVLISRGASQMGGLETIVSLQSVLLAFGFSVGIGIFFGLYPAIKASNLNPIDALRYE
ncbi:MAG: ABC transporter permease [Nitrospinaceae bacterium]